MIFCPRRILGNIVFSLWPRLNICATRKNGPGTIRQAGGKNFVDPVSREDRERPGAAMPEAQRRAATAKSLPFPTKTVANIRQERENFSTALKALAGQEWSRIDAPWTVEAHAYRHKQTLVVHLVNYNHKENAAGKSVSERESPVAAEPVRWLCACRPDFR